MDQGLLNTATLSNLAFTSRVSVADDDDEPVWWLPKISALKLFSSVTLFIILAQLILFIYVVFVLSVASPTVNPTLGPTPCGLITFGAKFSPFIVHKAEYWRLVTANFIHSGFITLIITILLEIVLMLPIEIEFGRIIVFVVFIISGMTGYTFSAVASPVSVDTGGLCAAMGFVGFRVSLGILDWDSVMRGRRKFGTIEIGSAIITLIVGQSPFVDSYGSFVGFVMGCFLGGAYFANKIDTAEPTQKLVAVLAILASVFVIFVCAFLLAAGSYPLLDQIIWTSICVKTTSSLFSNFQLPS